MALNSYARCPTQDLCAPERNALTHQVIQVWERIILYQECTEAELREVVDILLDLVDGTTDEMLPAQRHSSLPFPRAMSSSCGKLDRYEFTEQNQYVMECKVAACRLVLQARGGVGTGAPRVRGGGDGRTPRARDVVTRWDSGGTL